MRDNVPTTPGQFQFSSDEKHQATLDLLQEVLEHLNRLPLVPVTRDLCRKIQQHLDEPTQRLVQEHQAELNRTLTQTNFSAAGIPVIAATLVGRRLTLRAPVLARESDHELAKAPEYAQERRHVTETIINGLSAPDGLTLDLFRPRSPL